MTRTPLIDIIAATAFLAVSLGAYGAWYHVVGKSSAQAAELRGELDSRGEASGRAAAAKKIFAELSGQESDVYRHLVAQNDIVSFLETVQSTGGKAGAKVEVVSVTPAEKNRITLAVRITGSFDAVTRALGALEYQPYGTTLSSLTFQSQGASVGIWEADATFSVGMLPAGVPQPALAPIAVPVSTSTAVTASTSRP